MELKTRSFSYEFNKFMLEDLAAKSKRHNLDTWFDCCRKIAVDSKMSVEFLVTFEPTIADPKKFGNRITAPGLPDLARASQRPRLGGRPARFRWG